MSPFNDSTLRLEKAFSYWADQHFYPDIGWIFKDKPNNITYDKSVSDPQENTIKIEEKVRDFYPRFESQGDDILVELMQDISENPLTEKKVIGWFWREKPDKLIYCRLKDKKPCDIFVVNWEQFFWLVKQLLKTKNKDWIQDHIVISQKGYGVTFNIAIPVTDIPNNFYQKHIIPPEKADKFTEFLKGS